MKRPFLIVLIYLFTQAAGKAQAIKIFYEPKDRSFVFYANNEELYPVSVFIQFELTNLLFSEGVRNVFVLPPKSEKFKIGELTPGEENGSSRFKYKYISTMGNVTVKTYDTTFEYDLPFEKGKSYKLSQGYNGRFSHKNENALDFLMPEGAPVLAAREGIVVKIIQHNTESCTGVECKKYNNYVIIMHSDGTFAEYVHIKYNGSAVKPGDSVKRGDIIAYSGNVGLSSGPHLHFSCFLAEFGKWKTLETKFRVADGTISSVLNEGTIYTRNY
jgi:murein DD-endopeptidase MepM/ murein hydrolase activator NlpD